ncbi:MAG: ribonuclease P protein component [Gammaproteobacteria bacterium]|nr:ribonuclease P protein component [Gammaproteobacteria bacterium]
MFSVLSKQAGFPRDSRLLQPAQYRSVFQHPIKSTDDCFAVLCRSSGRAAPRLGLAVSKKYARLAVDRNRIKRVIRESFRCHGEELDGIDYVVLNRKGTSSMSNRVLFDSLSRHWKRLQKKVASSKG